jgi:hypothetical protein
MESRIFGKDDGFPGEIEEFLFAVGPSGIEDFGNVPVQVRSRCDDVAVHGRVQGHETRQAIGLLGGKDEVREIRVVLVVVLADEEEAGEESS